MASQGTHNGCHEFEMQSCRCPDDGREFDDSLLIDLI